MRLEHHTKTKGDKGLGFVIAAFLGAGFQVALPLSEHLPFDLIAISGKALKKVSVKYRSAVKGSVEIALRGVWSNQQGTHTTFLQRGDVDAHALYCPDTKLCYFVRDAEITSRRGFKLRLEEPKTPHPQSRPAHLYTDPTRLFIS